MPSAGPCPRLAACALVVAWGGCGDDPTHDGRVLIGTVRAGEADSPALGDGTIQRDSAPHQDGAIQRDGEVRDGAHVDIPDSVPAKPDGSLSDMPLTDAVPPDSGAGCVPKPEKCNGLDDDCDGVADDGACDDGNTCTWDVCKPTMKYCEHTPEDFGPCDLDASQCTPDTCDAATCVAGKKKACGDGSPCTLDTCDPVSALCAHQVQDGAACEDGNKCTAGDTCAAATCLSGTPITCDDGNACTADACVVGTGACGLSAVADGQACTDGNVCTAGDACKGGKCAGLATPCEDFNLCTTDACDAKLGCTHALADGLACNDGLACTLGETCKGGACGTAAGKGCNDANPCTIDLCGAGGACVHQTTKGGCDDGNACTAGETCATGTCTGSAAIGCDDQNPCSADGCSAALGCTHKAAAGACSDGNPCTVGDVCSGGQCAAGPGSACNDGVACTQDSCSAKTGACAHVPLPALCNDGDLCSIDQCTLTGCTHTAVKNCCGGDSCAPGDVCITYSSAASSFCAKPCSAGTGCPDTCCFMTWSVKHCIRAQDKALCCGTTEHWATKTDPYRCGIGGLNSCHLYPNPEPPYYPSKILHCDPPCVVNGQCPGSCCGTSTLAKNSCIWTQTPYPQLFCGKL